MRWAMRGPMPLSWRPRVGRWVRAGGRRATHLDCLLAGEDGVLCAPDGVDGGLEGADLVGVAGRARILVVEVCERAGVSASGARGEAGRTLGQELDDGVVGARCGGGEGTCGDGWGEEATASEGAGEHAGRKGQAWDKRAPRDLLALPSSSPSSPSPPRRRDRRRRRPTQRPTRPPRSPVRPLGHLAHKHLPKKAAASVSHHARRPRVLLLLQHPAQVQQHVRPAAAPDNLPALQRCHLRPLPGRLRRPHPAALQYAPHSSLPVPSFLTPTSALAPAPQPIKKTSKTGPAPARHRPERAQGGARRPRTAT